MRWIDIRKQFPNRFVLLENVIEEKLSEKESRIISGDVLETSDDVKAIMKAYREQAAMGKKVIYSLPNTPDDFIVEDVAFMGIMR
jgi:hypothetical protein